MNSRRALCKFGVIVCAGAALGANATIMAAANRQPETSTPQPASDDLTVEDALTLGAEILPIPAGAQHTEHVVYLDESEGGVASVIVFDRPAYSNIPPPVEFLSLPFANIQVADDITTVAIGGCNMTAFQFQVAGGGDGTGPGFTATYRAYTACPTTGGTPIPGTSGSLALNHNGLHTVTLDLTGSPVTMPSTFWFGIKFDRPGPGWVLGTPATFGYTENRYDFQFTPCNARFGGTTLYAGFYFQMNCQEPFDREFQAYRNMNLASRASPAATIGGRTTWS